MVGGNAKNSDSFTVTTPSDQEVRLTRLFDAPRELVFEAMTKPEHVKQWWGRLGDGYSVPECTIDLRVGGAWRFVNRHPHGEVVFYGEYQEIAPPSRLVFTEIFADFPDTVSVVTTVFTEENGQTRMTATVRYPSAEVRDMVLGTGMAKGAGLSYDALEALLATLRKARLK
ncbi:MAG: SRPBCC family protein [Pseudomonadota bacterium]